MTYLVVDETTKQAALVDPVYDFMQQYVDLLTHEDLTLVYVIATHTHADHITACFSLQEMYDCDYVMPIETASLGSPCTPTTKRRSCSAPSRFSSMPLPATPTIP